MGQTVAIRASSTKAMWIISTMDTCITWLETRSRSIPFPWMPTIPPPAPPDMHASPMIQHTSMVLIAGTKPFPMGTMWITSWMDTFTIHIMDIAIIMAKFNLHSDYEPRKPRENPGAFLFHFTLFKRSIHLMDCFFDARCDFIQRQMIQTRFIKRIL